MTIAATAATALPQANELSPIRTYTRKVEGGRLIGPYRTILAEIKQKIDEWGALYNEWKDLPPSGRVGLGEKQNSRFWAEVDKYIEYRQWKENIKEPIIHYADLIARYSEPKIDPNTAPESRKKERSSARRAREKSERLLAGTKDHCKNMQDLRAEISQALLILRTKGEPLAKLCTTEREGGLRETFWNVASAVLNYTSTVTPYFTAARDQRLKEIQKKEAAEAQS